MNYSTEPAVIIVPGLNDPTPDHWLHQLACSHARVVPRPPEGAHLDRDAWVASLESTVSAITDDIVLVAHSAGVLTVVHWAQRPSREIQAALLITPPDFEKPPTNAPEIRRIGAAHGWCPIPRGRLPFPTTLAASTSDPFATDRRVIGMAEAWGSRPVHLGPVGHLDPAAGYGPWPRATSLLTELISTTTHSTTEVHR
ncbi:RBBP9/YdeN family alpha/beta hydrolase [Nocardia aurantiaca]|uniref:Alpha/beta hydrolase n=1 Tax=Nocardia aurantiaca TaxID=2675850 RepID=A0A6I3L122_9NOCA|nr:alpha/beta hydrolase [Nocardia aurantiaca]MTE15507.1 alpha/beta hydrolase [Nocardia aurantiaca]